MNDETNEEKRARQQNDSLTIIIWMAKFVGLFIAIYLVYSFFMFIFDII